jgi:hypothetical protein
MPLASWHSNLRDHMAFMLVPIEPSLRLLETFTLPGSLTFGGWLAVLCLMERSGFGSMAGNSEFANGHSKSNQVCLLPS